VQNALFLFAVFTLTFIVTDANKVRKISDKEYSVLLFASF